MAKQKIYLGALILVVLTTTFYIYLPDEVRIDFEKTRTIFKIFEDNTFVVSGKESVRIFDGSTRMLAKSRENVFDIREGMTIVTKEAIMFRDDITIIQTYTFANNISDVTQVPLSEEICFNNAQGKIFEWLITSITYSGESQPISSPFSFGKKMKIEFQEGYHIAKVVNSKTVPDKILIRYRITENQQCFNVRLFDPPADSGITEFLTSIVFGADDAEEKSFLGGVDSDDAVLDLFDGPLASHTHIGLIFREITLPRNAIITNASIQFNIITSFAAGESNFSIEQVDNATDMASSLNNITNRLVADQMNISWSIPALTGNQNSSNLSLLIANITNRPGWKLGNNMMFIFHDDGAGVAIADMSAFEDAGDNPTLYIDYTTPVTSIIGLNDSTVELGIDIVNIVWNSTVRGVSFFNTSLFNISFPNGTLYFSSNFSNGELNLTPANLSVIGNYSIRLFANDSESNTDLDTDYFILNDTINPNVTLLFPADNAIWDNSTVVDFRFNVTDAGLMITSCSIYFNSTFNTTSTSITKNVSNLITIVVGNNSLLWNTSCIDNNNNTGLSDELFTIVVASPTLVQNIKLQFNLIDWNASAPNGLFYNPNMSLIGVNFSNLSILLTGNYDWNFTQLGLLPVNYTVFTYNFTNNLTYPVLVNIHQNQTIAGFRYVWKCGGIQIENTPTTVTTVGAENQTVLMNCTLDLNNISQIYIAWNVTNNTAIWGFNLTLNATN